MEENKIKALSQDKVLREMKLWYENECSMLDDYDTLWEMFRTVITSSNYGTSEFGGPIWLMDFSLANLQKLFPDNPWLEAMEKEWDKGKWSHSGMAKSEVLKRFSEWFQYRVEHLVRWLGLGNVIVKQETDFEGNISLYGWGIFLDVVQSIVGGRVERLHHELMLKYNFSYNEVGEVIHGNYPTRLKSDSMFKKFPCNYGHGFSYCKHSNIYGDCYQLKHFSLTTGYVIPETAQEKFLMLVVNDLMECKAQGYGNKADKDGYTVPYPQMKFAQYLECKNACNHHFQPTTDIFRWKRKDGYVEEIAIELPKIDAKYGEFWHRQFPPKQNWRELK